MNVVILCGAVSRPPSTRPLPSGDQLVALEVTTPPPQGRAKQVPVVRPTGPERLLRLEAGAEVVVTGRVRRRFFRAGGATASRTEVVADAVWPAHHAARVARVLDQAVERVGVPASRE
ncbi:MAG: single-stranded DNA-binding protein [Iamia sp.]